MDLVDGIIVVLLIFAALHGRRVGAVAQLISLAGVAAGLAIGVVLVVAVVPHVHSTVGKTLVALVLLIAPASLLSSAGRHLGFLAWRALRHVPLARPLDALIGSVVAVAGTLVVCWLLGSILVNSELSGLSSAISRSKIIRDVQSALPPVPDSFAAVDRYLSTSGFPVVFANIVPESTGAVSLPSPAAVNAAVAHAGGSVLKVVAIGCGQEQEGSSFAVTPDLVATNAHVIAGTGSVTVHLRSGAVLSATPVYFNPSLDLALLRLPGASLTPLALDPNYVERGQDAAVLGYPNNGPFDAQPAGVLTRTVAQGRDIYDQSSTSRVVYGLHADVQPGNSGGPLVAPDGAVLGVVFSRSAVQPDLGYALASPPVLQAITVAERNDGARVSTEGCAG
ncbi:MAG TPA: MarP family serine protease [Acidimicrobiales bacterium]|nr:MarP family serine protease [Acidimicrobiales bacterium]